MFSEQMSKEHNMDILVDRLMDKLSYPEGHPYSYEPGGLASEIVKDTGRLSELTEYQRKYFHLKNMVSKLKLKHYLNLKIKSPIPFQNISNKFSRILHLSI
ncbi:unnamed protein product [Meloidogyne enterolobii]|uniref:Uncharacterized protein n=1 Tax=Meloidogyne enterolobii TaxID=390850 RepID=A0ACB1A0G4_MELEN